MLTLADRDTPGKVGAAGPAAPPAPANSNVPAPRTIDRSVFPADAEARISPWHRLAAGGRRGARKGWRLTFAPRDRRRVEPLMGWTASDDMLGQIELSFPTLDAAVTYAERQGLRYSVDGADDAAGATVSQRAQSRAERGYPFILSARLAAAWLEMRYGAVQAADELQPGQEQKSESESMIVAVCPAPGARSAASG